MEYSHLVTTILRGFRRFARAFGKSTGGMYDFFAIFNRSYEIPPFRELDPNELESRELVL